MDADTFLQFLSWKVANTNEERQKWPLEFGIVYRLTESEFDYLTVKMIPIADTDEILSARSQGISEATLYFMKAERIIDSLRMAVEDYKVLSDKIKNIYGALWSSFKIKPKED